MTNRAQARGAASQWCGASPNQCEMPPQAFGMQCGALLRITPVQSLHEQRATGHGRSDTCVVRQRAFQQHGVLPTLRDPRHAARRESRLGRGLDLLFNLMLVLCAILAGLWTIFNG